jgi:4'-phosphopantetheinyl transferase
MASEEVHCWCVRLDVAPEAFDGLYATLADDERKRSARFRFEHDRRRFVIAHGALRDLMGGYLETDPRHIHFIHNAAGKPELTPVMGGRLRFNLSHSADLALIAIVTDADIGVDVECIRPESDYAEIARSFFSIREIEELARVPNHRKAETFLRCWTRREAFVKARGEGLGDGPIEPSGDWSLFPLHPAPGYVGALAVEGLGWHLIQRHWSYQVRPLPTHSRP